MDYFCQLNTLEIKYLINRGFISNQLNSKHIFYGTEEKEEKAIQKR
jgi:hypothetical protein